MLGATAAHVCSSSFALCFLLKDEDEISLSVVCVPCITWMQAE